MQLQDVSKLLTSLGFTDLRLVSSEGQAHTFRYADLDPKRLKTLGEPTITTDKKTAIYKLPTVGRLGLSIRANTLRVIVDRTVQEHEEKDPDLGTLKIPTSLTKAWPQAIVNKTLHVPLAKKAWTLFNEQCFEGRLAIPRLEVSATPAGYSGRASGVYFGGNLFTPGRLWVNEYAFNTRLPFFVTTIVHEMCHQAVWTLDKHRATSKSDIHGPKWIRWMRHCGLPPEVRDHTDEIEYADSDKKADIQEKRALLGPKVDPAKVKALVPMHSPVPGTCYCVYGDRLLVGQLRIVNGKVTFTFRRTDGELRMLAFKKFSDAKLYMDPAK